MFKVHVICLDDLSAHLHQEKDTAYDVNEKESRAELDSLIKVHCHVSENNLFTIRKVIGKRAKNWVRWEAGATGVAMKLALSPVNSEQKKYIRQFQCDWPYDID